MCRRPFGPFGGAAQEPPRRGHAAAQAQQEDTDALQLYLFGVEAGQLREVAQRLEVTSQVAPTQRLQGADAVLAARGKVSQVRGAPWCMPRPPSFSTACCTVAVLASAISADADAGRLPASPCHDWPHHWVRLQAAPL